MKHFPLMKGTVKTYIVSSDKSMKKRNKDYGVMNEDFVNKIQFALTVVMRSTQ